MKKELRSLTVDEYMSLLKSGMLWEIYPEATGSPSYDLDDSDRN